MAYGDCELDAQQVEAVVACEDAQLVLASAGSGKTFSLLAKIDYLYRQLHIPAEQILVISFTQKTVVELKERCLVKGIEIRTFHSLGNSILRSAQDSALGAKKLIGEAELASFIRSYSEFLIDHDSQFARDIIDFLLFFFSAPISPAMPSSFAEKVNYNRQYLRRALAQKDSNLIRMKDEQLLANWLYLYQLPYRYQLPIAGCDADYRPTFTLCLPRKIYVDYISVDQKGRSIFGSHYLRDVKWRANYHARCDNCYIALPAWR